MVAVSWGTRVAAADPTPPAGPDPGRIAYVGSGEHRGLQVMAAPTFSDGPGPGCGGGTCDGGTVPDPTVFTPLLGQGEAADDCQASARGDDVVWISDRVGDGEGIYRRTGGGPVTPVLLRPGWRLADPRLSPDRQWIAFASFEVGRDGGGTLDSESRCDDSDYRTVHADIDTASSLWIVRTDGTGLRRIAEHGGAPDWSPDGAQLVYTDGAKLYRLPVAGGTPVQLSPDGRLAFRPAWEPAGGEDRVAYVTVDPEDQRQRLVLVPAAGGGTPTVIARRRTGARWRSPGTGTARPSSASAGYRPHVRPAHRPPPRPAPSPPGSPPTRSTGTSGPSPSPRSAPRPTSPPSSAEGTAASWTSGRRGTPRAAASPSPGAAPPTPPAAAVRTARCC